MNSWITIAIVDNATFSYNNAKISSIFLFLLLKDYQNIHRLQTACIYKLLKLFEFFPTRQQCSETTKLVHGTLLNKDRLLPLIEFLAQKQTVNHSKQQ